MKNKKSAVQFMCCALFAFMCALFALYTSVNGALLPEELNNAIQEKTKQLKEIQQKLEETQKNLGETHEKSQSLKQELTKLVKNAQQLDLGIKKNQTTIEKLSLEINGLEYDINQTNAVIASREAAIQKIIQNIQDLDQENALVIFLKNKTISQAVDEQTRLQEVSFDLTNIVIDMKQLNEEREKKLANIGGKKKGIETEYKTLKVRKLLVEDTKKEQQELLTQTKNQEKLYTQIVTDLAKKQAEIAAEIETIDALLRNKINPRDLPRPGAGVLGYPLEDARMTQGYGATNFAVRGGYRGKWHNGVDFGGALGTPILAVESGAVVATGNQDTFCKKGAYGKFAAIKHLNNLVTLYGHLSQIAVQTGTQIKRGDTIGYMGKTGYALGTHLHFTVFDGSTFAMRSSRACGPMPSGGDLDPLKYL